MDGAPPTGTDTAAPAQPEQADHLRTISFRMREIQRLLAMRVEQENRRLEATGLDPVTDTNFRDTTTTD